MNKVKTMYQSAKELAQKANAKVAAGVAAGTAMVSASPAFAGGGGVSFDAGDILAAIAVMVAAGVLIYTAFAAGRWTLRAFGLIGGK